MKYWPKEIQWEINNKEKTKTSYSAAGAEEKVRAKYLRVCVPGVMGTWQAV